MACRPWRDNEFELVDPDVVVALGVTAGQAMWGSGLHVGVARGAVLEPAERPAVATMHPAAVQRARGAEQLRSSLASLVADLRRANDLERDA